MGGHSQQPAPVVIPPLKLPKEKPPAVMPDPDNVAARAEQQRAIAIEGASRGGRASTILSERGLNSASLADTNYQRPTLTPPASKNVLSEAGKRHQQQSAFDQNSSDALYALRGVGGVPLIAGGFK